MIVCVHVIDIAITMRTNAVHGLSLILEEQGQMEEVVERVSMCMCKSIHFAALKQYAMPVSGKALTLTLGHTHLLTIPFPFHFT